MGRRPDDHHVRVQAFGDLGRGLELGFGVPPPTRPMVTFRSRSSGLSCQIRIFGFCPSSCSRPL
jgi:hypothetical protein